jgi:hypothetical protein
MRPSGKQYPTYSRSQNKIQWWNVYFFLSASALWHCCLRSHILDHLESGVEGLRR